MKSWIPSLLIGLPLIVLASLFYAQHRHLEWELGLNLGFFALHLKEPPSAGAALLFSFSLGFFAGWITRWFRSRRKQSPPLESFSQDPW